MPKPPSVDGRVACCPAKSIVRASRVRGNRSGRCQREGAGGALLSSACWTVVTSPGVDGFAACNDLDAAGLGELIVPVYTHVPNDAFAVARCDPWAGVPGDGDSGKGISHPIVCRPFYGNVARVVVGYCQVVEDLQVLRAIDLGCGYIYDSWREVDWLGHCLLYS